MTAEQVLSPNEQDKLTGRGEAEITEAEAKALAGKKDRKGSSAARFAAENPDPQVLHWLKDAGAQLDEPNRYGRTPIFSVAQHAGSKQKLDILLDAGVDINQIDANGRPPIFDCAACEKPEKLNPFLESAGIKVSADKVENYQNYFKYWIAKGANLNVVDIEGNNILQAYLKDRASHDQSEPAVVRALIKLGVDPAHKNTDGLNALHMAASARDPDLLAALLDVTDINELDVQDKNGNTALTYAIHMASPGETTKVSMLLDAGASTGNGLDPDIISLAQKKNDATLLKVVKQAVKDKKKVEITDKAKLPLIGLLVGLTFGGLGAAIPAAANLGSLAFAQPWQLQLTLGLSFFAAAAIGFAVGVKLWRNWQATHPKKVQLQEESDGAAAGHELDTSGTQLDLSARSTARVSARQSMDDADLAELSYTSTGTPARDAHRKSTSADAGSVGELEPAVTRRSSQRPDD